MEVREEEIEKQNKEEQDIKGNVDRTTYRDWIEDATSETVGRVWCQKLPKKKKLPRFTTYLYLYLRSICNYL